MLLVVSAAFCYGRRSGEAPQFPGSRFLDAPKMFYPLRAWGFGQVGNGEVPLWNPRILCGVPNVAELQSAIFYPPNLIFVALSPAEAFTLCLAFHLFLSGAFAYALLIYYGCSRPAALGAGLTYLLCGPQVTHLWAGHLTMVCVIAWAPLLVLLFDRIARERCLPSALFGSLVVAMQLLAGHPQCALYSLHTVLLVALALAAWRFRIEGRWAALCQRLALAAFSLGLGFILAALQLAPGWEFVPHSARGHIGYEWPGTHSMPPENALTLLVPEFFFNWGREYLWETCAYVGLIPLMLCAVALARPRRRIVWFFAALSGLCFLLAFSRYTPFYHAACRLLPGFRLFRGHAKYLVTGALGLSVLAGFGFDALLSIEAERIRRWSRIALGSALGFAVLLWVGFLTSSNGSHPPEWWSGLLAWAGSTQILMSAQLLAVTWNLMLESAVRSTIMLGLGALWLGWAARAKPGSQWVWSFGVVAILLDLSLFAWRYSEVSPAPVAAEFRTAGPTASRPGPSGRRRARAAQDGQENTAMLRGEPSAEGYVGNVSASYSEFFRAAQGEAPHKVDFTFRRRGGACLSAFFAEGPRAGSAPLDCQWLDGLPRAFYVPEPAGPEGEGWFRPSVKDEAADALPLRRSLWPARLSSLADLAKSVDVESYTNGHIALRMPEAIPGRGYVVLTDAFYPGWKATVDGRMGPTIRAYHTFRAARIRSDAQRLEFAYDPLSFRLGLAISLLGFASWMAILVGLGFHRLAERRS